MKKLLIFTISMLVSCIVCATAYAGLNDGLVASYQFNGNANDGSGKGNHGTVYSAILTNDRFGKPNSAYSFDGVDDYILIGNSPDFAFGTGVTFSAWICPASADPLGLGHIILNKWVNGNEDKTLGYGPNLKAGLLFFTGPFSPYISINSKDNVAVQEWTHIVGVYNGQVAAIYINGVYSSSLSATGSIINSNGKMYIGNNPDRILVEHYPYGFNGAIDDICIFNRALSESEIRLLASVNPPINDFGNKAISWSSTQRFTVTNRRLETLSIGDLSITGINSSEFIIQNDNCSGATLVPQETRTFDVVFNAASLGSKSAKSIIPITSPSVETWEVSLSGLVTEPCECDLNADSRCNMRDWLVFGEEWGRIDCNVQGTLPCECDLNKDGRCNMRDWLIFGQDWGRTDCPVQ